MQTDFDEPIDRTHTHSLKWDRYANRDVLPMWVADMDFASPPCVRKALHERIEHGIFGYTLVSEELTEVIIERFRTMYGWPIEKEWIVWLPGVVPGLHAASHAYTEPGDEILTFTPIYQPFLTTPELTGRKLISIDLVRRNGRMTIDHDAVAAALTPRTKLILLCQPHNPGGRVFGADELSPLITLCAERNIVLCSDEIHCDLILADTPHHPLPSLSPAAATHSFTLMSPGKTFNTAGLNLGFAVVPDPELRKRFETARKDLLPHPNVLALTACLSAYRDGEPWRQELLQILRRNEQLVRDTVGKCEGLELDPVEATYLAWIDARGLDKRSPYAHFRNAGLGLSDGAAFGAPGYVRLNFACPLPMLQEGLSRMATS